MTDHEYGPHSSGGHDEDCEFIGMRRVLVSNQPTVPPGWRWWRDPATGSRLIQEYAANGAPKTSMIAFAYDPYDDKLCMGGCLYEAEERGAAKAFRLKPVIGMASQHRMQIADFEAHLPPDDWAEKGPIETAVAAERTRCAKIAREYGAEYLDQCSCGGEIAAKIEAGE